MVYGKILNFIDYEESYNTKSHDGHDNNKLTKLKIHG